MDYDVDEMEDLDLMEIRSSDQKVGLAGVSESGGVYLAGDLHPLGSASALLAAAHAHVPYVSVSAVCVLYPAEWLRGECLGNADRLRIIDNLVAFVRGSR